MDAMTLFHHSSNSAHDWMRRARDDVGTLFDADRYPDVTTDQRIRLAITLAQLAAFDFAVMWLGQIAERSGEDIANSLADIADALCRPSSGT
jgi:hypothetical protein